jgi:hypothetical protein
MVIQVRVSKNNLAAYVQISGIDPKAPETLFLMREIQLIWELNVERFFQRHNISYPSMNKGFRKSTSIRTLFSCSLVKGIIIGSIDTSNAEYVRYLIHGVPAGEGAFIPVLGKRIKSGMFGGISSIYWATWESFFKNEINLLIQKYSIDIDLDARRPRRKRKHPDINAARAAAVKKVRNQVSSLAGRLL